MLVRGLGGLIAGLLILVGGSGLATASEDQAAPAAYPVPIFGPAHNYAVETEPSSVAVGDFNRDGHLDLAATNWSSNTVSVRLGTSTGVFGAVVSHAVGAQPNSVALGDFNHDDHLDLTVVVYGANVVAVLMGDGNGGFGAPTTFAVASYPLKVGVGDFNRDGILDLAVATYSYVSVLLGTGAGGQQLRRGGVPGGAGGGRF